MVPSARAEFLGRRTATGRVSAAGCERDVAPRQNQLTGAAETKFVVCESPIHTGFSARKGIGPRRPVMGRAYDPHSRHAGLLGHAAGQLHSGIGGSMAQAVIRIESSRTRRRAMCLHCRVGVHAPAAEYLRIMGCQPDTMTVDPKA